MEFFDWLKFFFNWKKNPERIDVDIFTFSMLPDQGPTVHLISSRPEGWIAAKKNDGYWDNQIIQGKWV